MKRFLCLMGLGFLTTASGCSSSSSLRVVDRVELNRYLGKWYEIARYPNRFERNCVGATAEYELRPDGKIQVVNSCHKGGLDGPVDNIKGTARVVDTKTNAKLKVTFFWPFSGDYWIIDLDPEYRWAVIGEPRRKYLWILSRTPSLDPAVYDGILGRLPDQGYDPAKLEAQPQAAQ